MTPSLKLRHIFPLFAAFGLNATAEELDFAKAESSASEHGAAAIEISKAGILATDLKNYVDRLASVEYEGRGTGDKGERMATAYLASFFDGLGLAPEGDEDTYYQEFSFNAGKKAEEGNFFTLKLAEPLGLMRSLEPGKIYQPLSFSPNGKVEATGVVFAGFGIQKDDYDSFEGVDVEGKWVLVFRGTPKDRKDLQQQGTLVSKANLLKKLGAAGIIFAKMGHPDISSEVIPASTNVGGRGAILSSVSISDRFAASLLAGGEKGDVADELFAGYFSGDKVAGFPMPYVVEAEIKLTPAKREGRNVLGRLMVGEKPTKETIVIGAHIDHLGFGNRGGSRAKGKDATKAHLGADDNASGVAAIMEVAQFFAEQKRAGKLELKRDLVFAGWSGEEMGLHGSRHFIAAAKKTAGGNDAAVYPSIAAYLNVDMVGRLEDDALTLAGAGSSERWDEVLKAVKPDGFEVSRTESPYLPTDSTPFYTAGVPVLAFFTGLHDEYHTPRDTVDKIDFEGLGKVSKYLGDVTGAVANLDRAPDYVKFARNPRPKVLIGMRGEDIPGLGGVKVVEVTPRMPAEKAGIKVGDVVKKLNDKRVANMQGLLRILTDVKASEEYPTIVEREGETVELKLAPVAR